MRRLILLTCAILGNAFGLALMLETDLGASVWGAATSNLSVFLNITEGVSIISISLLFYVVAVVLNRKIVLYETLFSMMFLAAYGTLLNGFLWLLPDMAAWSMWVLIPLNIFGMLILLFSISLHLHVNIAVHPLDVYLKAMQATFKRVAYGTYLAYGSAFALAIVFGLLAGGIVDIGIGTLLIVVFGGVIMDFYEKLIFSRWKENVDVSH